MSGKISLRKVFVVLLFFIVSVKLLYSFEIDSRNSYSLLLPENKLIPDQVYTVVKTNDSEPGEFVDVDLPDDIKYKKQNELILAEAGDQLSSLVEKSQPLKYYSIQVAMFRDRSNAEKLKEKMASQFYRVEIVERINIKGAIRYDVRYGRYKSRHQAEQALNQYKAKNNSGAYIIAPK